jgi:hypothetical protein
MNRAKARAVARKPPSQAPWAPALREVYRGIKELIDQPMQYNCSYLYGVIAYP